MKAAKVARWFDNEAWLFVDSWLVRRNAFVNCLVIAVGIAAAFGELGLRHLGFVSTHGATVGAAVAVVGASGLLVAAMAWLVLRLCDLVF